MVEMTNTLTWLGLACWVGCLWWMHRISSRRETTLKEVHPQVRQTNGHVDKASQAVATEETNKQPQKVSR